jgi:hypothetical protein
MKVKIVEKDVLNPLAEIEAIKLEVNPIPENINKISLFDNTKPNANLILKIIAEGNKTCRRPCNTTTTRKCSSS